MKRNPELCEKGTGVKGAMNCHPSRELTYSFQKNICDFVKWIRGPLYFLAGVRCNLGCYNGEIGAVSARRLVPDNLISSVRYPFGGGAKCGQVATDLAFAIKFFSLLPTLYVT